MEVGTSLPSIDPFDRNHICFLQVEAMDQISDVGEQRPNQDESQKTIRENFAGFARELAELRAKAEKLDKEMAALRAKSDEAAKERAALQAKSEEWDKEMAALRAKSEEAAQERAALRAKSEEAAKERAALRAKSEEAAQERAALRAKLQNSEDEFVALNSRIAARNARMFVEVRNADLEIQSKPASQKETFIPGDSRFSVHVSWKNEMNSKLCYR